MSSTLGGLCSSELPSFFIYDTINATQLHYTNPSESAAVLGPAPPEAAAAEQQQMRVQGGKRKRRRRPRSGGSKEEVESQRMTHIAVERNRRRLMNDHLAVLRSLMPDSYIQRGDQASIVGGAIDYVKELEQLLQSLEAKKRTLLLQQQDHQKPTTHNDGYADSPPFAQFFAYPQYVWRHVARDYPFPESRPAVADIEVSLIETHASVRILSSKRPSQLLRIVAGLHTLRLTVLHLNVTAFDSMVLFSISVKVEEGCSLTTVDDIAAAVHHIISLIDAEMASIGQ
uniref:BHLH domain-containing protein n=1 Tax=Ananas comosus var. bracteatus TaxID=296719 RepID=A0A6V7QZ34_ANACO